MPIVAAPAKPGIWLDTDEPLDDDAVLDAVVAYGAVGIFGYGPLPGVSPQNDITSARLNRILSKGLQCGIVQHPRFQGWDPGAHSGGDDAIHLAEYSAAEGYPLGAHLFQDFEGPKVGVTVSVCQTFLDDWRIGCTAAQFLQGLYHGFDVPLSGLELYRLLGYDCYWRAPGQVTVAVRGDAIVQGGEVTIGGCKFDRNELKTDALGGLPMVATMAA